MSPRFFFALLLVFALGCASDDSVRTAGHALTLHAEMSPGAEGMLAFQSPAAAILTFTPAEVIGKPYYLGVFEAGFSPGNDLPLFEKWGTVPESLNIAETTPAMFAPGAYDLTIMIYTTTPISDAQYNLQAARPTTTSGNLASFTLSSDGVLPGDPDQALGTLRMNVKDTDVSVSITNRTPVDPMDLAEVTETFDYTILVLP